MAAALVPAASSGGSFLITPNVGLMVWTLLLFGLSMLLLWKLAFPRITEALDRRQHAIDESIDAAERARQQAGQLLEDYRARLTEAREQADEIVARARRAGEAHEREAEEDAKARRDRLMEQTRKDIEAETRRAIQEIRLQVADLTVLATEKVTRKVLTPEDQQRLVEDALSGFDFSALTADTDGRNNYGQMEEIGQVYARALFEVAQERSKLDEIHDELNAFTDAMNDNRNLAVFFFSPYFSVEDKKAGLERAVINPDPAFGNFLEALIERHRMPAIFRIRTEFTALYDEARKLLPVQITSAVALDPATVKSLGETIGKQVDRQIELSADVDPDILGGVVLRVGNLILDASIKNRLEQLRKQVAQA